LTAYNKGRDATSEKKGACLGMVICKKAEKTAFSECDAHTRVTNVEAQRKDKVAGSCWKGGRTREVEPLGLELENRAVP